MNTNFLHNILNVIIALTAIVALPEVMAVIPAEWGVKIAAASAGLKLVINAIRDGFSGMVKEQPPVKDNA